MTAPIPAAQEQSRSRWAGPLAVGLAVVGSTVLIAAFSIWIGQSPGWAYDFQAYYDAALRLIATGSPYQAETLAGPFSPGPFGLYLYAPPLAMLFVSLTWLGGQLAVLVWLGLRVGILGATCALLPVSRGIRLAAFGIAALSAPFLFDLNLGNVSTIVTFFAVATWRWLDRPLGSVALAAALTLRPTMAVVAGWWLLRGRWRPVLWVAIAAGLIFLATLPFIGLDQWLEYVTVLRNVSNVTGARSNVDLGSSVLLLGGPTWLASLALFAGYATAALAVLFSLRRDRELSYVVTVMASLLVSPLLWDHYLTNLLLPAAFLASRGRAWALALPLLCWLPQLLAIWFPSTRGIAEVVLPYIAVAGLLAPFAAKDRGEAAGFILERLRRRPWRASGPVRA
ncbi:MAG: glycosyltransferase family 87 protein [Chloroflexota bacterium]